jgi:hypothetical protein
MIKDSKRFLSGFEFGVLYSEKKIPFLTLSTFDL